MIDVAYPLQWPQGWKRTMFPERSRFAQYPFGRARDDVLRELERLGATDIIISSNLQLRQDGLPYAGQRQPDDRGIAVYFTLDGEQQCIPCDRWSSVEQNLRAIAKTIDALRGIERWGAKDMVNAAFRGFKALPEHAAEHKDDWWIVLDCRKDATWDEVQVSYRVMAKKTHPDSQNGSEEKFKEVHEAYEYAKRIFNGN